MLRQPEGESIAGKRRALGVSMLDHLHRDARSTAPQAGAHRPEGER